jgi:release factor glutamine methyltransferase
MIKIYKIILEKIFKPILLLYLKKERTFKYKSLILEIKPGVFHPKFFYSSKIFAEFIESLTLKNKRILDLGTGSGILALNAAKLSGISTASDFSELAIQNVKINAELNNLKLTIIKSDLFDDIPKQIFDYIFINPPYYAKNPENESDFAWYCGNEFQYYSKLFDQIAEYINVDSKVFMILSESCDLKSIMNVANNYDVKLNEIFQKKVFFEQFFIFEIEKLKNK